MSDGALRRIWGLMSATSRCTVRSWPRLLELMYWPVLQMVVWGFITAYLAGLPGQHRLDRRRRAAGPACCCGR